jgi:GTPase-associated protein 1, N-terminal domain type 2/GTPase-associated protein 1, middle domain
MSQELIYTSAPAGLAPGTRGFCVVASTPNMLASLTERLEALSAYRHVFQPHDPNAPLNPIAYSHLKLSVSGRTCHVLSRVAAAGVDYTNRTNKFAHHVVLDPVELPAAGPAWLMLQPGFMETAFNGQPRILPIGRQPPRADQGPAVCRAWQQLTGDAGWGGLLAETAADNSRPGAMIIYRPGMNMLPLVTEAIALLPPDKRWEVTFTTYFTKLPPGIDCKWRFVLDASPEVTARIPGMLIVDLSRPLPCTVNNAWSQAARTGSPPMLAPPIPSRQSIKVAPKVARLPVPALAASGAAAQSREIANRGVPPRLPVVERDIPDQIVLPEDRIARDENSRLDCGSSNSSQSRLLIPFVITFGLLLVALCATVFIVYRSKDTEQQTARNANAKTEEAKPPSSKAAHEYVYSPPREFFPLRRILKDIEYELESVRSTASMLGGAAWVAIDTYARDVSAAIDSCRQGTEGRLKQSHDDAAAALEAFPSSIDLPQMSNTGWKAISGLNVPAGTGLLFKLHTVPAASIKFAIQDSFKINDENSIWCVVSREDVTGTTAHIADFSLKDSSLNFRWIEQSSVSQLLRSSALEIALGADQSLRKFVALRPAENAQPLSLDLLKKTGDDTAEWHNQVSHLPKKSVLKLGRISSDYPHTQVRVRDPNKVELEFKAPADQGSAKDLPSIRCALLVTSDDSNVTIRTIYLGVNIDHDSLERMPQELASFIKERSFDHENHKVDHSGIYLIRTSQLERWKQKTDQQIDYDEEQNLNEQVAKLNPTAKNYNSDVGNLQGEKTSRANSRKSRTQDFKTFFENVANAKLGFEILLELDASRSIPLFEANLKKS